MALLEGKTCVVTGGAGSIGLASVKRFLAEGARVMIVDFDEARLEQAADALSAHGEAFATFQADVAKAEAVKGYLQATVDAFGPIDVLFSNAGSSGVNAPIVDYPDEVFDRVMEVNVRGTFLACKYGLPLMNDGGAIIVTSSIMGVIASPSIVGYTTSKHALVGLVRCVAKEVAARGIRVNVLAPGPVDNEFQTEIERRITAATGIDGTRMLNERIPLGRHADADEIARMALVLASDLSSFSTAGVFMADGGLNS